MFLSSVGGDRMRYPQNHFFRAPMPVHAAPASRAKGHCREPPGLCQKRSSITDVSWYAGKPSFFLTIKLCMSAGKVVRIVSPLQFLMLSAASISVISRQLAFSVVKGIFLLIQSHGASCNLLREQAQANTFLSSANCCSAVL